MAVCSIAGAIAANLAKFAAEDRFLYDSAFTKLMAEHAFQQLMSTCCTLGGDLAPDPPDPLRQSLGGRVALEKRAKQTTAQDVLYAAKRSNGAFHEAMRALLAGQEGVYLAGPIKSESRIQEKATTDYALEPGERDPYSRIIDAVRGTCLFETAEGMLAFVRKLKERSIQGTFSVVRVKDRICTKPVGSGYRDCLMNIEVDGFICELQLQFQQYNELKETFGHRTYEWSRTLQAHELGMLQHVHAHQDDSGTHWKVKFGEAELAGACAADGGALNELCRREGAVIHEAVLRDCKGDETHAAKVTAAFIVAEFCKVLKSGRTAATEAAAHSNEEALTLMCELGMHLDTADCNGDTPRAASGNAAAATHIAGLLSSGAANGDAAAAKITAMLLQPGGVPQPAVDYPASNKGGLISHGSLQYTNPLQQEEPSERHAV